MASSLLKYQTTDFHAPPPQTHPLQKVAFPLVGKKSIDFLPIRGFLLVGSVLHVLSWSDFAPLSRYFVDY